MDYISVSQPSMIWGISSRQIQTLYKEGRVPCDKRVGNGLPTYAYGFETAVYNDHVLVPYYNYEEKTKFLEEGITYDDLSDADQARYEDDFAEDDYIPDFIPSAKLN